MSARYAIYYAPESGSGLAAFADGWIGETGRAVCGAAGSDAEDALDVPSKYGFHGTLKPPFHLKPPYGESNLRDGAAMFADGHPPVSASPLELTVIGSFIALVPGADSPEVVSLAENCVLFFDLYRETPTPAERRRRLRAGLTERQKELLQQFGYPFVLDEFRFHLTLTGKLPRNESRRRLMDLLRPMVAPFTNNRLEIKEICLFKQPSPEEGFQCIERFPLNGRIL